MRVGIYNRWLATLGGGEKESLGVAEYLSRRHSVTVISHTSVPRDLAASRLNLDLSAVEFMTIPDRPASDIPPITAEYDFFLNASHMDFFPSLAKRSAILVFFPTPVELQRKTNLHSLMKRATRRLLMVPAFTTGVISLDMKSPFHLRLVESPLTVMLPASRDGYRVRFDLANRQAGAREALLSLNGSEVAKVILPADGRFTSCELTVPAAGQKKDHKLVIQSNGSNEVMEGIDRPGKMALTRFVIENPRYHLYQLIFESWIKDLGWRIHFIPQQINSILKSLESYDAIWACSEFSCHWIQKYWRRSGDLLYPPIDIANFAPGQKLNRILNVGRFFAGSHNKKHLVMIEAFKEMVANGLNGWELHLAGGVNQGSMHAEYLEHVRQASAGFPITLHCDIAFDDLKRLYGESAIYWHASGYGESEKYEPEKFEHFGITTVEAMASGCVPVVIGKGGQPEIVRNGSNGFLWQTTRQLKDQTWRLIRDSVLRQSLANTALRDSRKYGKDQFDQRLQELLWRIGVE
jgi:glycosyltransferase involved in cell wall biosynthesis